MFVVSWKRRLNNSLMKNLFGIWILDLSMDSNIWREVGLQVNSKYPTLGNWTSCKYTQADFLNNYFKQYIWSKLYLYLVLLYCCYYCRISSRLLPSIIYHQCHISPNFILFTRTITNQFTKINMQLIFPRIINVGHHHTCLKLIMLTSHQPCLNTLLAYNP